MISIRPPRDRDLNDDELRQVVEMAFQAPHFDGRRILFVIPDYTRSMPMVQVFRAIYEVLADRVETLDFMIALGTHPPMSQEAINKLLGVTEEEWTTRYSRARVFNHAWDDPDALTVIGTIGEDEIEALSEGLMRQQAHP